MNDDLIISPCDGYPGIQQGIARSIFHHAQELGNTSVNALRDNCDAVPALVSGLGVVDFDVYFSR
jgi:hypothetical protein